jgi:hypothetical protein
MPRTVRVDQAFEALEVAAAASESAVQLVALKTKRVRRTCAERSRGQGRQEANRHRDSEWTMKAAWES